MLDSQTNQSLPIPLAFLVVLSVLLRENETCGTPLFSTVKTFDGPSPSTVKLGLLKLLFFALAITDELAN